jgi:Fur family ferric uptake transcriptional regulator
MRFLDFRKLVNKIDKEGLKKTKLILFLAKTLTKTKKPISVPELLDIAKKKGFNFNKTSFYRQIKKLKEKQIVQEVKFIDNKKRYELVEGDHHHHLLCFSCGNVEDLFDESEIISFERKIQKEKRFLIKNHLIEFFGLCNKCAFKKNEN